MYVYCGTVHSSKDLEPTQMPINDTLDKENLDKKMHIYTMEYDAACNEFLSFAGTCMNLETTILSKLTQEQKIKHCMFSLIGGC